MQTAIYQYANEQWQPSSGLSLPADQAQFVLCFAAKKICAETNLYQNIKEKFPKAEVAICSTAGEICNDMVTDNSIVATAFYFDKAEVKTAGISIYDFNNSHEAAIALVDKLPKEKLAYILILSDGSLVNGSELVKGLNDAVSGAVSISGGLAGDGADFSSTLIGLNEQPTQGNIIAIGWYGNITVTHGSQGGWETFGPERTITKAKDNVLFELDAKNALDLYKKYLGNDAEHLPGSALLFPLSIILPGSQQSVTRTILSIDADNNSMTFAGDVPEGSRVRFMKANFDKLITAASSAAQETTSKEPALPGFSLLISCVGRKLILGPRIEEEVEAVKEILGESSSMAGFYSYGEISPFYNGSKCHLHNQTMTITSFYEFS